MQDCDSQTSVCTWISCRAEIPGFPDFWLCRSELMPDNLHPEWWLRLQVKNLTLGSTDVGHSRYPFSHNNLHPMLIEYFPYLLFKPSSCRIWTYKHLQLNSSPRPISHFLSLHFSVEFLPLWSCQHKARAMCESSLFLLQHGYANFSSGVYCHERGHTA